MPNAHVRVDTEQGNLNVSGDVANPIDAERAMNIVRGFTPAGQTAINNLAVSSAVQVNLRVRIAEMSRTLTRDIGVNWSSLSSLGKYAAIGLASSNPLVAAATSGSSGIINPTYAFNTPGHTANINAVIDALAQDQLIHMLPNRT